MKRQTNPTDQDLGNQAENFPHEHSITVTVTRMKRFCVFLIKEDKDYIITAARSKMSP